MPPVPTRRSLTIAYAASLLVALGVLANVGAGLGPGGDALYRDSSLVLVSRGADVANLVLVLPILLGATLLARRGSLLGLLLWPGSLFYVLYAYVPYLVGAPFGRLFFVHVGLVTISAFTVIGLVASIDGDEVRRRLSAIPARGVGAALAVIALAAYAGLAGTAISALADPTSEAVTRPLAVADWGLGTPVLLLGGVLLWLRMPLGYVAGPGLLLVSGLGGAAFALAAVVDNLGSGPHTDGVVIVVHLLIGAVGFALLTVIEARARHPASTGDDPGRGPSPVR